MTGTVTVSPLRRKRGWPMRTMMFLRTRTRLRVEPNSEAAVPARTVARQVVRESGKLSETRAWPEPSVWTEGCQKAVSGKSFRILGWTTLLPGLTWASCGR